MISAIVNPLFRLLLRVSRERQALQDKPCDFCVVSSILGVVLRNAANSSSYIDNSNHFHLPRIGLIHLIVKLTV